MKISFLIPDFQLYGGIRRIIELSNHLVDFGHAVYIFHTDGSGCEWLEVKAEIKSLADFFEFEHGHLIYAFHPQYSDVARAKAKHKYYYNLNLYNKRRLKWWPLFLLKLWDDYMYWLKKSLLDKNAKVFVNCTDSKIWLKENFGLDVEVVFGGVNQKLFHPVDIKKKQGEIKVLTTGSPKYWKGTKIVEQAIKIVRKKYPQVAFETYHGKGYAQSKLAEVYSSADIFVDAQYYLGWNNPIAEAMACKVPVICGDVGQNKDIALQGETAILVPVRSPEKYAETIIRLINDKALRDKVVKNAFKKISEFTWEKAARKLEGILIKFT
jgi:glycosyltransferase involved in cell wall biosynthesis